MPLPQYNWDATSFFETLTSKNALCIKNGFIFCRVSGLQGFEDCLANMQSGKAFVAVSDISQGYTEINNTPHTRRVKTVFLAMRHKMDDMKARQSCMDIMREVFRQFMSRLILEKTTIEEESIYLDTRISFNEIDEYFFSGCACAYFQIATDVYTDLRYNPNEWSLKELLYRELYLVEVASKMDTIRLVRTITGLGLTEAKRLVDNVPSLIITTQDVSDVKFDDDVADLKALGNTIEVREIWGYPE